MSLCTCGLSACVCVYMCMCGLSACVCVCVGSHGINSVFRQELYDTLEKERPSLFRLASDTDEKDQDAISMYHFLCKTCAELECHPTYYTCMTCGFKPDTK